MELKEVARVLERQLNIATDEVRETNSEYFQGKKDGLRVALTLLYEGLGEGDRAKMVEATRRSSHGLQATQKEKLKAVLSDAIIVFGDFVTTVFEKNKPDYRTAVNAYNWFGWALRLYKEIFEEEIEGAILPEFPKLKGY